MANPKSTHYNPDVAKALKDAAGKDDEQKTSVKDGDKKKGRGGGSAGQKAKRKSRSKAKKGKGKGKGRGKKRPRDADGEDDDEDEDADGLEDDDAEDTACLHHHFRVKSKHLLFNFAPVHFDNQISCLQESDGFIDEEGAEDPQDDIDEEEEDSI